MILMGDNNKTYKFALAKSIIELAQNGTNELLVEDIAIVFNKYMLEHVKSGTIQGVKPYGEYLDACQKFLNGEVEEDKLLKMLVSRIIQNPIKRLHTVNRQPIPKSFYDHSSKKKLVIRDEFFHLIEGPHGSSLFHEIEARWRLVERAWELKVDPKILEVEYDEESKIFYINKNSEGKTRRIDVTNARDALNGYQKGHCFFCFDHISLESGSNNVCHVDHFFAHTLFDRLNNSVNYNGVWNLVLSCQDCNSTKSAQCPDFSYLERLHNRNEHYIESHHPLRESLMKTGESEKQRIAFLQSRYNEASKELVAKFLTLSKKEPRF